MRSDAPVNLLQAFQERGLWVMLGFGYLAGLPFPLSTFTLRMWLTEGGVPLTTIGLTASIGLAYSLKFLWAPVLDRRPPWVLQRLGRRRGWLAIIQPALAAAAAVLALSDPASHPLASIAAAAAVAFLSASQDIVVDAWRIEVFPQRLQGAALAAYVWGYRLALLTSGAGVLWMAGPLTWHGALLVIALLLGMGVLLGLLAAPEPRAQPRAAATGRAGLLRQALLEPLLDFLSRPGAWTILAFVALFKLGEAMAGIMTPSFYRFLGFSRDVIGGTGLVSLTATLAGIALGGMLVARIGVRRALLWTGWAQTIAMGMYVALSYTPGNTGMLYGTVFVEAFAQGMADAAFLTFLSGLCSLAFTATHYALLSAVSSIAIHLLGSSSGRLAEWAGWHLFYTLCLFAALPAMALMLRLLHRYGDQPARATAAETATG